MHEYFSSIVKSDVFVTDEVNRKEIVTIGVKKTVSSSRTKGIKIEKNGM